MLGMDRWRQCEDSGQIFVSEDAQCGAIHVLVLAAAQGPEEGRKPGQAERERHWNEVYENVHIARSSMRIRPADAGAMRAGCLRARTRSELSVTRIDEPDIAAAAISGVA